MLDFSCAGGFAKEQDSGVLSSDLEKEDADPDKWYIEDDGLPANSSAMAYDLARRRMLSNNDVNCLSDDSDGLDDVAIPSRQTKMAPEQMQRQR